MHFLYIWPGACGLPSIDPTCAVVAAYCQLLLAEFEIVECSDFTESLPFLKHGEHTYAASNILPYLLQLNPQDSKAGLDEKAIHSLVNYDILPLVLHSLFSLPVNYTFVRKLVAANLPFPANLYRPESLRQSAQNIIEATHPDWWTLGGEAEKDEEDERRRKRVLLETGPEGFKDRKIEEKKQEKEIIKKAFGSAQIVSSATECFTRLESLLGKSTTPYFFDRSTPSPLDAHLSALLSLVLDIPLPQPLLANLVKSKFPLLLSHTILLRQSLWTTPPKTTQQPSTLVSSLSALGPLLIPSHWFANTDTTKSKKAVKKESKAERDFRIKRNVFLGVVGVGVVGWSFVTMVLLGSGNLKEEEEEEEYWVDPDQ